MFGRRGEERKLVTVLFTDIVGSTERAAELGDRRWREVINEHHAIVRRALRNHGGREVDTAGDGFFATFDAPARAIACAIEAIGEVRRRLGVELRAGVHTGEVERVGPKVGGIAVHVGARALGAAGPGEVLVTSTVRELVGGSGLRFVDRGTHQLKGVPEPWHLYALEVSPSPDGEVEVETVSRTRGAAAVGDRRIVAAAAIGGLLVVVVLGATLTGERVGLPGSGGPGGSPVAVTSFAASGPGSLAPSAAVPGSFAPAPDSAVTLASDGSLLRSQSVGNDPGDVTVGGSAVWVANLGSSTVSRIDPGGGAESTIGGIGRPSSLAYEPSAERLWVLDGLGAKVSIVDARNGKVLDSFRQTGRGIAFGSGLVWVADEVDDAVIVIDPLSRKVVATVTLPAGSAPVAVAVGNDAVWVAAKGSSAVVRIDPGKRALKGAAIAIAGRPTAISVGDALWVASGPDDALIRLDPTDGRVAQTYPSVCDEPGGLAAVADSVWLTCRRDGTVLRVGPGGVNVTTKVGFVPNDVAAEGDTLWVSLAAE